QICEDKYTFAAFISPSGDGLKVLVKIPPEIENHEKYYFGLIKKYPSLDTTSKNISRVCFASYDPEIYINENSEVFKDKGKIVETKETKQIIEAVNTDYKKLDAAIEIIRSAVDGEKHKKLVKAGYLAGGFIGGGLVEEHEALRILQLEINKKNPDDYKAACIALQKSIDSGKNFPIYEETFKIRYEEIIKQDIIIEDEPAKDVIYLEDIKDKIIYTFENGTSQGETTHYPEIDKHFRHKRGEITLMAGIGNHGKSAMMYQLALIKSKLDNYKWGIFSPESMPEEEFYKDLIHSYIGKSTEKHHANQMTLEELKEGMEFIKDHFYLIYPKNDSPTPDYMHNRFRELIIKHNIDGCIIDPFNQLENDLTKAGGREDVYLSKYLTTAKRFAVEQNVFYQIIAHPKGGLQKKGEDYNCPDIYDLSGGAMWGNKCDNILFTHRPYYSSDSENTLVKFISRKIKKQKLNGIPGDVELNFDRFTNRFKQMDGFCPLNKFGYSDEEEQKINPNTGFYEVEEIKF
ncbi:MAG: BT4734/BF3469 family protein, partial [Lutibacter sp.]